MYREQRGSLPSTGFPGTLQLGGSEAEPQAQDGHPQARATLWIESFSASSKQDHILSPLYHPTQRPPEQPPYIRKHSTLSLRFLVVPAPLSAAEPPHGLDAKVTSHLLRRQGTWVREKKPIHERWYLWTVHGRLHTTCAIPRFIASLERVHKRSRLFFSAELGVAQLQDNKGKFV